MKKLPKTDKPLFKLYLPSQKRDVLARPFVAKEEKILLTAQQSGEEKDIVLALQQVINNCIQEEGFNINCLTTFDLEYMFLKLRARSVNNIIEVSYRDGEDEKLYDFVIDLDKVEMLDMGQDNKIMINDEVGMVLKYPQIDLITNAPDNLDATQLVEYLFRESIDQIFDAEDVYLASDYTEEELNDFFEDLDIPTLNKIRDFFENLPKMYYKIEYENSLGSKRVIELTTLSDFFTLV